MKVDTDDSTKCELHVVGVAARDPSADDVVLCCAAVEVPGKDGAVDTDVIEGIAELVDSVVEILTAALVGVLALSLFAAELVAWVQALAIAVMTSARIIHVLTRDRRDDPAFSGPGCPLKDTGDDTKLTRVADG